MSTPSYQLLCTKNDRIAEGIYDFRFNRPIELQFTAGQFVLFDVPLLENAADIQTRAFSIASAPEEEELIFVAKIIEGGRMSRFIEESLRPGDSMRIQGPFGRFVIDESATKDLLFICTSSGIAPFRSQALHLLSQNSDRKIDILFGARHQEDLFWVQEFEALAALHSNFSFHIILSQPNSEWKGHIGHVQDIIPVIAPNISKKSVYVCGNPAMTDALKKLCLEQWKVEKTALHVEGYV